MRKLTHISLALLLLVSTVGITVDKHYCGGSYVGTWLYAQLDACGMDMPENDDCCHDDITFYSIEDDFQFVSVSVVPQLQLLAHISFPIAENQYIVKDNFTHSYFWHSDLSPPSAPKIYIKVQSFLI